VVVSMAALKLREKDPSRADKSVDVSFHLVPLLTYLSQSTILVFYPD
jgi:hypothetical protein